MDIKTIPSNNKVLTSDKGTHFILMVLFFLSGLSSLIYEMVWSEELALIFGTTELAIAAVLASYMSGMALGSIVMSRFVDRIKNPVLIYALFEVLIALFALCMPWLLELINFAYQSFFSTRELSSISPAFAPVYLLGSIFVLLIPTSLMGATLPLLSKFVVQSESQIATGSGYLYAINTLGACLGALVSAFLLLPYLGLGQTVNVAVFLNVFIFILGVLFFRNKAVIVKNKAEPQRVSIINVWLLPILFISGMVSFSQEILWTRLLSHLLGGSIYSFGVMLFIFLFGIALGAALGVVISKSKQLIRNFSLIQVGIAGSFFISFYFADAMILINSNIDFGSLAFIFSALTIGAVSLLPGAVFIGAVFPLAVKICTNKFQNTASVSAQVYTSLTLGAICGAIITGFYLLSAIGFAHTAKALTLTSMILALLVLFKSRGLQLNKVFLSLLFFGILFFPLTEPKKLLKFSPLTSVQQQGDIEFLAVGNSSTVMLIDHGNEKRLLTNGLPESSIQAKGERISKFNLANWLSMLPVLSRQDIENMLIIGLGAGITLQAVPESVKKVDLIELEEEVILANKSQSDWRMNDPLEDSRLHIHHNDARNALRNSNVLFDSIVSQPSHPWTAGASHLYTQEFFSLVKSRLNNDGVFVQWIGLRFVDEDLLKSLVATLNEEFKYVEMYQPLSKGGLIFIASEHPVKIEKNDFNSAKNISQWNLLGVQSWSEFYLTNRLNAEQSRQFSKGAKLSTDYNNIMKIRSPKVINKPLSNKKMNGLLSVHDVIWDDLSNTSVFVLVRKLIKERGMERLKLMTSKMTDKEVKIVLENMILVSTTGNKQAKENLMDLLKHSTFNEEILYFFLKFENLYQFNQQRDFRLNQAISESDTAPNILEGYRLMALNKWRQVKSMEAFLSSIQAENPAFEMANQLRIDWRIQSDDNHDLMAASEMIDLALAVEMNFQNLEQRIKVALLLGRTDDAIAGIYELLMGVKNPRSDMNKIKRLLNKSFIELKAYKQANSSLQRYFDERMNKLNAVLKTKGLLN